MLSDEPRMTRKEFLRICGVAAGLSCGGLPPRLTVARQPLPAVEIPEAVTLKSWEIVAFSHLPPKRQQVMKITGSNGAVGFSRPVASDVAAAVSAVKGMNLLGHGELHDRLTARGVPTGQIATLDIAAWDLHARMLDKPLHALLGTKKTKILRYGDVRGTQPGFSPAKYADIVVRYLDRTGMQATKLHFPGNMGTPESIPLAMILETLRAVRQAVGTDRILAWDPYPSPAESATTSVDEAKQILALMDELGYGGSVSSGISGGDRSVAGRDLRSIDAGAVRQANGPTALSRSGRRFHGRRIGHDRRRTGLHPGRHA